MNADPIVRFEDKYIPEPNSGCWIWTGAVWKTHRSIRGRFFHGGAWKLASRSAYEILVGAIPSGLFVCHRCDTPLCVNPNHLWLGTHADNMADMVRKGRSNRSYGGGGGGWTCNAGETNGRAKLSKDDVRSIRSDPAGDAKLAAQYGVSRYAIRDIKTGRTWASA